jgi:hypothetical protein
MTDHRRNEHAPKSNGAPDPATAPDQLSTDPVERRLGDALHRIADEAPTTPLADGRRIVERRVRQRAARRRRTLGAGVAVAVVAVSGGVLALRPEPPTRLSFGADPGGAAVPGVVTGYSTGSMTGSPHGWTTRDDLAADAVELPRLVADLDATWQPHRASALTSDQGSGSNAAPILVLTSGSQSVVVSVQSTRDLGPGRGEVVDVDGHHGVVTHEQDGSIQAIVDVDATHRALVTSIGLGRAALFPIVASLHQEAGSWVLDPPGGSDLRPVATTPATTYRQRTIEWGRQLGPDGSPMADPTVPLPADAANDTISVSISTGGAYEFWGLVGQRASWARVVPASVASTKVAGVTFVADLSFEDGSNSATIGLDANGLVYTVERWSFLGDKTGAPTVTPGARSVTVTLVPADDARWAQVVHSAAAYELAEQARTDQAIAQKRAEAAALGRQDAAKAGLDPANAVGTASPTTVPATAVPPTTVPATTP